MRSQNNPDRIRILFDDHRWWPMPACSCRPPSPGTWRGNSSPLTSAARRDGRTLQDAAGRFRAGRRRLRRRRCAARWWDGRCSRLRGQGIHPGDVPAQLPVGACPSTRRVSRQLLAGPLGPAPATRP